MKKLKYILILFLLLVPVSFVHAANVVTVPQDTTIALSNMNLTLENDSTFSSMTVNPTAGTVAFTLSAGGTITLTSNDRYGLNNDKPGDVSYICTSSLSSVTYSLSSSAPSDETITFTPGRLVCSGSGSTSGSGQSGSGAASAGQSTAKPATGTQSISKTVSGGVGGSVATTDAKAGMEIPAGIADGNVSMNIVPKDSSSYTTPVSGYSAVAVQVYDYSLSSGGNEMTSFSEAVTLTFSYTNSDIVGIDEDSLQVYYLDSGSWKLAGGAVDTNGNTVTVEVDHFTIFGVFGASTSEARTGDLIKLQCPTSADVNHTCKSVYYLGSDSKRYVFPNETTYSSWYADFSSVKIVASDIMASYGIGGNVTMRPGTHMIKITTDPKVYAVEPDGKLRWVDSEETAENLYGTNWVYKIVDVSDAFFVNYDSSTAVEDKVSDKHPIGSLVKYPDSPDIYYVSGINTKRLISSTGFTTNNFRDEFVLNTNIVYGNGVNIIGVETLLNTTAGP